MADKKPARLGVRGHTPCNQSEERPDAAKESLFFNPRMAISGAFEGRTPLNHFLEKWAGLMIHLLQQDPLEGDQKARSPEALAMGCLELGDLVEVEAFHFRFRHGSPP